jgi:hypothetical protein
MERHLADAAVGELLGEGADQCQHRGTSGWNELWHPIKKWPICQSWATMLGNYFYGDTGFQEAI